MGDRAVFEDELRPDVVDDRAAGQGEGVVGDPVGGADALVKANSAATASIQYNWTKSLKNVLEATYAQSEAFSGAKKKSFQGALGLMLFF